MYVLRTRLLENPNVSFYYKGTATEKGVSFALNTKVGFEPSDAMQFDDKKTAIALCEKLNLDKSSLAKVGYSEFEVMIIYKQINRCSKPHLDRLRILCLYHRHLNPFHLEHMFQHIFHMMAFQEENNHHLILNNHHPQNPHDSQ